MRRLCFFVISMVLLSQGAWARRDFFVAKEVRCGLGGICYENSNGAPLSGKLRLYYDDGIVREECEYQNGVRNGVCSEFYPSGKQRIYTVYKDGLADGGATTYYESGNIDCEISFKSGKLDGERNCFFEEGERKSEEHYVDGVPEGKARYFRADGSLENEVVFNLGEAVLARCKQGNRRWIDYTPLYKVYSVLGKTPCSVP